MAVPEREHGRGPGADTVGGRRQQKGLFRGRFLDPQDRQRQQDADQQRDAHQLPIVGVFHRAGPGEFRLAAGVEDAPIRTDAAFEIFPGLIDRLDDVVFHADGFGAGDEVAQHQRLLERARVGVAQIVALARPAELGDHDALAGEQVAQQVVAVDGLVDRLVRAEVFPIGQHVRCDEIDVGAEVGIVAPDVPDLAGGDGHADRALHLLDHLDEVFDLLLAAVDHLVADHDADDVAVLAGELDGGLDLALVAILVLVDPGADGDLEAELGRDRRHQFHAARGRIEADRARHRRQRLHVGADFFDGRNVVDVGVGRALERRVGDAGQEAVEIGRGFPVAQDSPQPCMERRHEQQNGGDNAHRG